MSLLRLRYVAVSVSLSLGLAGTAMATPIIIGGSATTVASGGTAPGSSADYDFGDFSNGSGVPKNLTHVTFTPSSGGNKASVGSSLKAPGGASSFTSSEKYYGAATQTSFGTFTTTLSDFTIYLLTDNSYFYDTAVGLSVDGGGVVSVALSGTTNNTNVFVSFHVTGATSTDVFTIYATGKNQALPTTGTANRVALGGFTFQPDTAVTPEPDSLVLLGTGLLGALGVARRRFQTIR